MRKPAALILFVCVLISLLSPAASADEHSLPTQMLVSEGNNGLLEKGNLFVSGGRLYIQTPEWFYAWTPGASAPDKLGSKLWPDGPAAKDCRVCAMGESLYFIDAKAGTLYLVKASGEGVAEQAWPLPSQSEDGTPLPALYTISNAALSGENICCLVGAADIETPELWWFKPGDSVLTRTAAPGVAAISAYDDGGILALYADESRNAALSLWKKKESGGEHLVSLHVPMHFGERAALMYLKESGTVLLSGENAVYACSFTGERLNHWPTPGTPYALQVVNENLLASLSEIGLNVLDMRAPAPEKTAVTIAGGVSENLLTAAKAMNPDLDISVISDWSAERTAEALVSGNTDIDIFVTDSHEDMTDAMLSKGYFIPLNKSGGARAFAFGLFPAMRGAVCRGDDAFLMPLSMQINTMAYMPQALTELNLPEPTTFGEYMDALAGWTNGAYQDYPEYSFGQTESLKDELTQVAFNLYIDTARRAGETIAFDRPAFRAMMEKIESLDPVLLSSLGAMPEEERDLYPGLTVMPLFDSNWAYEPEQEHQYFSLGLPFKPVAMAMDGDTPALMGHMSAVGVSKFSLHPEAALRVIESLHGALSPVFTAAMTEERAEAVENPAYFLEVERYKTIIEDQKNMLENVKRQGGDTSPYEREIAAYQSKLDDREKTLKYLLTAEELERVHEKMACVYVPNDLCRAEDKSSLQTLFEQYLAGTLSLQMFIDKADATLRLVQMENK